MSRKFIIGGNWKCNPAKFRDATDLIKAWKDKPFDQEKVEVVVCPTALHLPALMDSMGAIGIMAGAQNVSKTDMGAFTGEWAAAQLKDLGVPWVVIGHSERRTKYGESDEDVGQKVGKAQAAGLKVILCIGELLEEREAGTTDAVNARMLDACLPMISDWDGIVIAYEPVWAIGTGKVATPDQAQEAHAAIRNYLREKAGAEVADKVRIQYGGSVSPDNCASLIEKPDIDGFLVGGASLKASFMDIVVAAQEA